MYEILMSNFNNIPLLIAFIAGILSFISPCILPMIPIYFSYITGISVSKMKEENFNHSLDIQTRKRIILLSLSFIFGFGSIFFVAGIFLDTIIGDLFVNPIARYISGALIILFGIHFIGILNISFLNKEKRTSFLDKYINEHSYISNFLFGISFALGWTPCVGPIFASIATLASTQKEMGTLLIALYIIGLSLPFLLLSLFITQFISLVDKIKTYMNLINLFSGILMIIVGLLIIFNKFSIFLGSFI